MFPGEVGTGFADKDMRISKRMPGGCAPPSLSCCGKLTASAPVGGRYILGACPNPWDCQPTETTMTKIPARRAACWARLIALRRDPPPAWRSAPKTYPSRAITVIVPFRGRQRERPWSPASWSTRMSQTMGQPIIIEKPPRAPAAISAPRSAPRPIPDGYTWDGERIGADRRQCDALPTSSVTDPVKDFEAVSPFAQLHHRGGGEHQAGR